MLEWLLCRLRKWRTSRNGLRSGQANRCRLRLEGSSDVLRACQLSGLHEELYMNRGNMQNNHLFLLLVKKVV